MKPRRLRRRRPPLAALAALVLAAAAAPALAAELGADLAGLLAHARAVHPELAAMRLDADAANERIVPAGALPDPVLRVELENLNNVGNSAGFNVLPWKVGETRYTLMQMLPLWGKRELRRDAAAADAAQAAARAAATWNELALRLKTAYAQYYQAHGSERLAGEVVELLARLEKLAQSRYAGGLAPQQDAIRAQIEQTMVRAELIGIGNDKRLARARLNALLARGTDEPLAEPRTLRELPALPDAEALAQRARSANPSLAAEQARLRAAQTNRELTLRNRYPDLQVGIAPVQMGSRITTFGIMVELSIPLQRESRRAQERESDAMAGAQRARTEALANQLRGELGEQLAALDAARRNEALVARELLPQSELSLRSALAGYETGKVDFAAVLEAQRQIRRARQELLKSRAEAQMRLAEIERTVGEEL